MLPAVAEAGLRRLGARRELGAGLGLLGVMAHQAMDGLQIGATWSAGPGAGVALSVTAHALPLVAVVVQPFAGSGWRRIGTLAAALLGATALGVIAGAQGASALPGATTWMPAVVGGLLLHVIWHALGDRPPGGGRARSAELLAFALGAGLPVLVMAQAEAEAGAKLAHPDLLHPLQHLTLALSPALLLGVGAAALLGTGARSLPEIAALADRRGPLASAVLGIWLALRAPANGSNLDTAARRLVRHRAAPALVVAFVLAAPELGLDTFTLTASLLGLPFALARLLGAGVAALVAAGVLTLGRSAGPGQDRAGRPPTAVVHSTFVESLDATLLQIGPWMATGLIAAACVQATLPAATFVDLQASGLALPLLSLLAIPTFISASAATPMAAVLLAKGLAVGPILAALLLGPATNLATLRLLSGLYGGAATARAMLAYVAVAWGLAGLAAWGLPPAAVDIGPLAPTVAPGPLHWGSAGLLLLLLLRSLWQVGPRAWAATLARQGARISAAPPRDSLG